MRTDPTDEASVNRSPWQPATPPTQTEIDAAAAAVTKVAAAGIPGDRMPAIYLGHGAPPLVDDRLWVAHWQHGRAPCPGRAPSSWCPHTGSRRL